MFKYTGILYGMKAIWLIVIDRVRLIYKTKRKLAFNQESAPVLIYEANFRHLSLISNRTIFDLLLPIDRFKNIDLPFHHQSRSAMELG